MRWLLLFLLIPLLTVHGQEFKFENRKLDTVPQGSRGVSIADLDNNGWLDIVVANQVDSTELAGNTIYFNENGNFRIEPIAAQNESAWSESVHTVDIDNDHDLDLFFTTQFGVPNLLFLNDGYGVFTAFDGGDLGSDLTNSPGACWCDYDLDGDLDVFVANRDGEDDQLYENDGAGRFTALKEGPWIGNGGDGRACAWGDLNGDGRPDLYIANFVVKQDGKVTGKHKNYLYWGDQGGSFTEQKEQVLVEERNASYGVTFIDYDYDMDLDVYITNVSGSDDNALYINSGVGAFKKLEDTAVAFATNRPSKGQTWADFNNDGLFDLYVANGTEGYPEIQNFFFSGQQNGSFKRIYDTLPAIDPHISAGTASGDLDNDGDLDLYVCNWGGEAEPNDCYINQGAKNQWIKLRLKGVTSNSHGIGSWAVLRLDDGAVLTRYLTRETGYGSENAPEIHFGIPYPRTIKALEILWPSGLQQQRFDVEVNTAYEVIEGKEFKSIRKHEE